MKNKGLISLTLICMVLALALAGCAKSTAPAQEASFPTKTITILNSSAAGSPTDVMARQIARVAERTLGQSMIVSNLTGGSGGVMLAHLMKEKSDGYIIATLTASQIAALQSDLKTHFKFEDFEFLANIQSEPYAIAVRSDSPFKSINDMMEYAKANPMKLKVGGQGTGSALHLLVLELAEANNAKISWIPLGGGAESVTSVLGGNMDVISTAPATVSQYVEAGQIRMLAVSADKRLAGYKDVPTLKELGYPELVMTQYRGFIAKKGIPAGAKARLVAAIQKATEDPGFQNYMAQNKMENAYMGPEEFTTYAKKDFELIGKLLGKMDK